MSETNRAYYKAISILFDLFLVNLTMYLAYETSLNLLHVLFINVLWINLTQLTKLYIDLFVKDAIPTIKQTLWSLFLFIAVMMVIELAAPELSASSNLFLLLSLFFTPALLFGKIAFLLLRRSKRTSLINYKQVVIIGAGPLGKELKEVLESNTDLGYQVNGFFDNYPSANDNLNILGKVDDCMAFVKNNNITEVFCALPNPSFDQVDFLIRQADAEMIRFKLVHDVQNYFKKTVHVQLYGHLPVFSPRKEPLENRGNQFVKRVFDVSFSIFICLFIMSWLVPVFALLIKLESKGPVFFKQLRSGKNNRPFYCLKFRSMQVNGEADTKQASYADSRITRIGAFMRRTSLDEMPQFFNVLLGDMSVVGPRPHMLQHTAAYSAIIDQFMVRHFLLPGITGWAQVKGLRGETKDDQAMEQRVKLDIWYLENWSIFLDLKIIFLTIWQILTGHKNAW
ncbi:undecaprenyl-phosphate galactose phosphotransferase/putative colanic acid biosynthesis UDP-glucose lipid carrier transferase [Pedobacter sp. CAN_A7]|uniref:undecaprenyl-phosphate glucose phosphotransferase n=1 Tax=Pedobacter sp. CAN_A7 TaxID=2787722 RepID=UPI0018CAE73C